MSPGNSSVAHICVCRVTGKKGGEEEYNFLPSA